MEKKGIIGLGNPLRQDDGISIVLIEKLRKENLPPNIELIDADSNEIKILHILEKLEKAIIVDTILMNKKPGDYLFFKPNQVNSLHSSNNSHNYDLLEIVELSERLKEAPKKVLIMGIQPNNFSIGEDISPELKKRIPELKNALLEKIIKI